MLEGPVHTELVTKRLLTICSINKAGNLIKRKLKQLIRICCGKENFKETDNFLWPYKLKTIPVRSPSNNDPDSIRDIEHIPPEEIQNAMLLITYHALGISQDALIKETANIFGINRVTRENKEILKKNYNHLEKSKVLSQNNGLTRLNTTVSKAISLKLEDKFKATGETIKSFSEKQDVFAISRKQSILIKTNVKSEMVLIPSGIFEMGTGNNVYNNERPVRKVYIYSFYMKKYEVTNKEYRLFKPCHKGVWWDSDYPVESVSWYDAVAYCNWLSKREGLSLCYSGSGNNIKMDMSKKGYRLPTEAEWEYACRAGTTTDYYWGDKIDGNYCWCYENSNETIHPAGQKQPNAWGLYDMSGNVWEWCWDWYDNYSADNQFNPIGPSSGSYRVNRGGSWGDGADNCRSAYRGDNRPDNAYDGLGFRTVRSVP